MSFDVAKQAADYFFENKYLFPESSVAYDFIGGEPLIEIELIDRICDYLQSRSRELDHSWTDTYSIRISTNGLLYSNEGVQRFIAKHKTRLSISISIDGTRSKHDSNRVYKNGKGSYDAVIKNVKLWITQFPDAGTKVTVSSDDLPYLKEGVLHLLDLGIKNLSVRTVFENVWKDGDDAVYEQQLTDLADHIIDNKLYDKFDLYLFDESIGKPLSKDDQHNWCDSLMIAVDASGVFYPCLRFAKFSLRNRKALSIGNVWDGVDTNKLRPFYSIDRCTQSPNQCVDCEIASGCGWCPAENYDVADTPTIFQRSTSICKMHKARVRAKNYYRNKLKSIV
ncbi:hypothetical protein FACS1894181_04670 [Bacteroidia bacterium]|nr:hypothetical protein FACS1894181_04670 [Bacteroidia bacterium]